MFPRTALNGLALLMLAGCAVPGVGYVGGGPLPLNVLAVTTVDPDTQNVTYKAVLQWPKAPGVKLYEVIRTFGDKPTVIPNGDKEGYVDTSVGAKQTFTYQVRALSGESKELTTSDKKSVTVLAQEVKAPGGLEPADNASLTDGASPTLRWQGAENANWYYVRVTKVSDGSVAFSALTKDTSIKFADASPLKFDNFGDLFPTSNAAGIARGLLYRWNVEAIRSEGATDPNRATALDLNTSGSVRFSQG